MDRAASLALPQAPSSRSGGQRREPGRPPMSYFAQLRCSLQDRTGGALTGVATDPSVHPNPAVGHAGSAVPTCARTDVTTIAMKLRRPCHISRTPGCNSLQDPGGTGAPCGQRATDGPAQPKPGLRSCGGLRRANGPGGERIDDRAPPRAWSYGTSAVRRGFDQVMGQLTPR